MRVPQPETFLRHAAPPAAGRQLDDVERRIILLARHEADRGRFLPATSLVARILARLTGNDGPRPLADARLEALRRFACLERRRDARSAHAAATLLGLGFPAEALASAATLACA